MIIVRSPLRITLGGGGTDLPSYYKKNEGFVASAAIDKYVYVSLMETFQKGIFLKYSSMEKVQNVNDIKHPIIREALKYFNLKNPRLEITVFSDIPAGTGLGSSGSFTTALLKGLSVFQKLKFSQTKLAELACHIEIDKLQEPVGKQDQYISVFGGLTSFLFQKDNKVISKSLKISSNTISKLQNNLMLFFSGFCRNASDILINQELKSQHNDLEMINNLNYVKNLGYKIKEALETGDILQFGELMKEHWDYKKRRSIKMSNPQIDEWYELAIKNGAIGGKIVGAGGGGFLLFLAHNKNLLSKTMTKAGLQEVHFKFDFEGTKILTIS
jgi:D-glycero-alpha-D-manno-heptose-7-phosphate kinase